MWQRLLSAGRHLMCVRACAAVLEAWTGAPAYEGQSGAAIFFSVVHQAERPHIPPDMPPAYAALVQDCWQQQAQDRPAIQSVLVRLRQLRADETGRPGAQQATAAADS